jgi:hypothetical protein
MSVRISRPVNGIVVSSQGLSVIAGAGLGNVERLRQTGGDGFGLFYTDRETNRRLQHVGPDRRSRVSRIIFEQTTPCGRSGGKS